MDKKRSKMFYVKIQTILATYLLDNVYGATQSVKVIFFPLQLLEYKETGRDCNFFAPYGAVFPIRTASKATMNVNANANAIGAVLPMRTASNAHSVTSSSRSQLR